MRVQEGGQERRPPERRWLEVTLDVLAVAGIVAVLALPAAALISVAPPPAVADPAIALPALRRVPAGESLREVPVLTRGGDAARAVAAGTVLTDQAAMDTAIEQQARVAFGPIGPGALPALVEARAADFSAAAGMSSPSPAVDAALDTLVGTAPLPEAEVAAVNDLAGLLVLAAAASPIAHDQWPAVAADLYARAGAEGACTPQLNQAFLRSTDTRTQQSGAGTITGTIYGDTVAAFHRAARDCRGHDATALWLLGQFQSGQRREGSAVETFRELERRDPGSPLGWSGEADALVRRAYRIGVPSPFSAKADFRRAEALYRRAAVLDPGDPGLVAGQARAADGRGHFRTAAARQRRASRMASVAASFQDRLVGYLEHSARFADAARAQVLATTAPAPRGRGLIGESTDFSFPGVPDEVAAEGALDPVSIGVGRLLPVQFQIVRQSALAFTDGVSDISFIPSFRATPGLTDSTGWCRHSRDLLLAGQRSAALADLSTRCTRSSSGVFEGVTRFEAGDQPGAVAGIQPFATHDYSSSRNPALATILDADQNLWRFAGRLVRAAEVAKHWSRLEPADPNGPDRAGEIAYLQRHYAAAAQHFAEAAKRARVNSEMFAHEQLKEGTARSMAGDFGEARRLLTAADAGAARFIPSTSTVTRSTPVLTQATLDSYNARVQAGDTELRAHRFKDAAVHYEEARAREAQLPAAADPRVLAASGGAPLLRPEVLENNQALVFVELGQHDAALEAIGRAVRMDPENPVFLGNEGFIEEKLGRVGAAKVAYRAALAGDATSFQAANNLGVLLADEGHLSLAADAFRQARAANPEYATAAFNLGLVLDRMGPSHLLESQGELAAATREEPELREHDRTLITDDESYFTTLDLSKPLPPDWHLASSQQRTSITVAGVVLALLLVRVAMTFLQDKTLERTASRTVGTSTARLPERAATFGIRLPGIFALVAVVAVFLYPLTRSSGTTTGDYLLLGAGVTITTLAFMRLRSAIARRHAIHAQHYPCLPAVAVGGVTALIGLGFAPMPATKNEGELPHRARWIATGLLGALTVVLIVIGKVSGVPIATQLGMVCLVMTASALLPIAPYDGEFFEKRHLGLLLAIALATLATLVELGVL